MDVEHVYMYLGRCTSCPHERPRGSSSRSWPASSSRTSKTAQAWQPRLGRCFFVPEIAVNKAAIEEVRRLLATISPPPFVLLLQMDREVACPFFATTPFSIYFSRTFIYLFIKYFDFLCI
jgi:hypothetical protein